MPVPRPPPGTHLKQILSPSQFQAARTPPEAPLFAPPTSPPPAPLLAPGNTETTLVPVKNEQLPSPPASTSPKAASVIKPTMGWRCGLCERPFPSELECDQHVRTIHLIGSTSPVGSSPPSPDTPIASPTTNHDSPTSRPTEENPLFTIFNTPVARPKENCFTCKTCGLSLKSLPDYRRHCNTHQAPPQAPPQPSQSGPKNKEFVCQTCERRFRKHGDFRRHMATHRESPHPIFQPTAAAHGSGSNPLPSTSEPPAEPARPSPTTRPLFAEIVQGAATPRTTSASTAHDPTRPVNHHTHTDPPNSPIMCHICKAGPFRNIPLKDLHVEFAHSRKVPRVILQREKIFTNSNLPPTHLPPNDHPVRVKSGPSSLPGFLSPAPPTADSQELFQENRPRRRGRPPASSGTTPTIMTHPPHTASRSRPLGGRNQNHKPSSARCPEEDLDDAPLSCDRKGQTLHVSFPMARALQCPEQGCPNTFASGSWTSILQSIKRHLKQDHQTPILKVKKWCSICPGVCPDRITFHPCFSGRDPTFIPSTDQTFTCDKCEFQCSARRQLRNHAALHRNEALRVPRRPFKSADLHPNRTRRNRDLHLVPPPPTQNPPPRQPPGNSNTRPQGPRSKLDWIRSNLPSNPTNLHGPATQPTQASSPVDPLMPPTSTMSPPSPSPQEQPARDTRMGTIDEMAEWIAAADLPAPPTKKRRRRGRRRISSSSDSDIDPAALEELRRNNTPNPSTQSSIQHSPSIPASSAPFLASGLDSASAIDYDVPPSHQSPSPPCDDDSSPLDDFTSPLGAFLSCNSTFDDTLWSDFEDLLGELTTRIADLVKLPPIRDDSGKPPPTSIDAGDHRTIQRLYKRNRRRAIRLITEGEGSRCHLESHAILQHFEEVFKPSTYDPAMFPQTTGRSTVPMDPFTPDEVKARLYRFENSAPGPDRLSYAHLKEVDPSCLILAKIINICLRARRIPSQWKTSKTILIHKKGDPEVVSNWRPISLCSTMYKLLTGCLATRLTNWLSAEEVLSTAQKGFMPFDGTFEHHFLVSREIRRTKTKGEELCLAQIDLANAFGSVPHAAIDTALLAAGAGEDFTQLVHDLYAGTSTSFIAGDGTTDLMDVRNGVRQGCPLSGPLFNMAIDPLVRAIQESTTQDDDTYNILAFADDLLLIAKSQEELQTLLDLLPPITKRLGLLVNPAKCRSIHLSGITPRGHRPTPFNIGGQPLEIIPDHIPASFLGTPIGFQLCQNTEEIERLLALAKQIGESCLAPWQRIDALKSFFFPSLNFAMRTGEYSKEQLRQIDVEVRKFVKVTLNLVGPASSASNHYLYGASDAGCLGLPCLEDEHDVVLVDSAFKLLTSRDPRVRHIAWMDLADQIQARTATHDSRPEATPADVAAFLSGSCDAPFHRGRSDLSSVWSAARNASRRLGVSWSCPEWSLISISYQEKTIQPPDRRILQKSIKSLIRTDRALQLQAYPSQGVAMECVAGSKWGNQFLRTGENIRFCDWRFIHKARLNLCSLNAQRHSSPQEEVDRSCRRCDHQYENLHHVVSSCRPLLHLRTKRHDAVLERLVRARRRGLRVMGRNQDVDGSGLRPDLVLTQGDTAILIDVAVPYENRISAFSTTRRDKAAKYTQVCNNLRRSFANVHNESIIVGALGSWDRANDSVLRKFVNKRYANKLRRLICTDVLSHTCDIFHQHVRGQLPDQARLSSQRGRLPHEANPVDPPAPPPMRIASPGPSTDQATALHGNHHARSPTTPSHATKDTHTIQVTFQPQASPTSEPDPDEPPSSFEARFQRIIADTITRSPPQPDDCLLLPSSRTDTVRLPPLPASESLNFDFPISGHMPGPPTVCAFLPTGERAPPHSPL
ncbi:hypothetical protein JTE90_006781 [Oedothorax gibbosus]|uniref:Reverse transcriptase n=1 Tax=Oedothorax gibbosus TaxID=931172 RepID=A0AAV6UL12_9ARAC|nr:hypothetical protein JTE90_006781 [Oedothorax gibbosus]